MATTTFLVVKNNSVSSLNASLIAGATSLTLISGEGALFPSTFPYHITIDDEILNVTARATDVLTIGRGVESTGDATHAGGATVELRITAKLLSDLNSAVNTLETISHTTYTDALAITAIGKEKQLLIGSSVGQSI